MGTAVLQNMEQISEARSELLSRGLGWKRSKVSEVLSRLRLSPRQIDIGDELKSWDVLRTANFAIKNLAHTDQILDIGAFASEILIVLHRAGFSNLAGVDMNPALRSMPYSDLIRYEVANFLDIPLSDNFCSLITAISVIEHGYQPERLFREVARLLRPGGYFVASFDYWPETISTDGIQMFGMDWKIFSRQDVNDMIEKAGEYGLHVFGGIDLEASGQPISCMDRHYTFAWIALRKSG